MADGRQKAKKSELAGITRSGADLRFTTVLGSFRHIGNGQQAPPISNRKSSTVVFEMRRTGGASEEDDLCSRIPGEFRETKNS